MWHIMARLIKTFCFSKFITFPFSHIWCIVGGTVGGRGYNNWYRQKLLQSSNNSIRKNIYNSLFFKFSCGCKCNLQRSFDYECMKLNGFYCHTMIVSKTPLKQHPNNAIFFYFYFFSSVFFFFSKHRHCQCQCTLKSWKVLCAWCCPSNQV